MSRLASTSLKAFVSIGQMLVIATSPNAILALLSHIKADAWHDQIKALSSKEFLHGILQQNLGLESKGPLLISLMSAISNKPPCI